MALFRRKSPDTEGTLFSRPASSFSSASQAPPIASSSASSSSSSTTTSDARQDPNDRSLRPSRLAPGYDASMEEKSSDGKPPPVLNPNPFAPSSLSAAAKRFSSNEVPCMRKSLLLGLGTLTGATAIGWAAGRPFSKSASWGGVGFIFVSAANWEMCKRARKLEAGRMKVIQEEYHRRGGRGKSGSSAADGSTSDGQSRLSQ